MALLALRDFEGWPCSDRRTGVSPRIGPQLKALLPQTRLRNSGNLSRIPNPSDPSDIEFNVIEGVAELRGTIPSDSARAVNLTAVRGCRTILRVWRWSTGSRS